MITQEIIKSVLDKIDKIQEFKYVAENWGQLDFFGDNAPVKYPCCLVEFGKIIYTNEGELTQRAIADITLTVANLITHNTSTKSPEYHLATNLNFYDLIDLLQKNIHGWKPECQSVQGNLTRNGFSKQPKRNGLKIGTVIYSLEFVDNTASVEHQTLCKTPTISITAIIN